MAELDPCLQLEALFTVARDGMHPAGEMPFRIPRTDALTRADFLAHLDDQLASWAPDAWELNLVVFLDGQPIGVQTFAGDRFSATRTVQTGSWLGNPHQRKG
jgi:hypothetical protein